MTDTHTTQSATYSELAPWQRAAFCLSIAERNHIHVLMVCELNEPEAINSQPYSKLTNKMWTYLTGELKSEKNLQRFIEEFYTWQEQYFAQLDSFGEQAAAITRQALTSACDSLFDDSLDECELVSQSIYELLDDLLELQGAEAQEDVDQLKQLEADFQQEIINRLQRINQRGDKSIIELRKLSGIEKMSSIGIAYE